MDFDGDLERLRRTSEDQATTAATRFAYHLIIQPVAEDTFATMVIYDLRESLDREFGVGKIAVIEEPRNRIRIRASDEVEPETLRRHIAGRGFTVVAQMSGP